MTARQRTHLYCDVCSDELGEVRSWRQSEVDFEKGADVNGLEETKNEPFPSPPRVATTEYIPLRPKLKSSVFNERSLPVGVDEIRGKSRLK